MKKVLYISYYYLPASLSAAQRVYSFARYIKSFKPYVLCPENIDAIYTNDKNLGDEESIHVIRVPSINLSFFRRAKNEGMGISKKRKKVTAKSFLFSILVSFLYPDKGLFWLYNAIKIGSEKVKNENIPIIFSTSPLFSNHLIAFFIKKRCAVKWIVDFRDFHYLQHNEKRNYGFKFMDRFLENKFLHKADEVVFISVQMRDYYMDRYPFLKGKSIVVSNGFDAAEFEDKSTLNNKVKKIFYAGTFYNGLRSPFPLLASISFLLDNNYIKAKEISIEIVGHIESHLTQQFSKYSAHKIVNILGPKNRFDTIQKMKSSDFLWLIVPDKINFSVGMPVKGYEYMATQNTILGYVPLGSTADELIRKTNTGLVLDDNMSSEIIQKNAFLILNALQLPQERPNMHEIKKLTREIQAQKLENIFYQMHSEV